ncbi:MAG: phosphatase [Gammaproteobacteria bacterium RBG_16_57_12]|nr:MAG: phosphatase [Gammaproteobacteria bacterium RBG_16_57_12]
MRYDLHTHSTASDGTLTPGGLVERARAQGIDVLALTDHDTLAGIPEARLAARRCGLALVPGVEISVTWGGMTVHIVGVNVDIAHPPLLEGLTRLCEFRGWRAGEIGRRLEHKAGIAGAWAGACHHARGGLVSRTHFARFLVEQGQARDMQDAFVRFLKRGKPGYVAGQWASLEEAVGWISGAGGQAIVAHPARYDMTATKLRMLLGEFKECGGEAMEVISGSHASHEYPVLAAQAEKSRLLSSAGSDYHGPENPWIDLGRLPPLPKACVPIWHDWELPRAAGQ